jgi:AcrR family transcriptional regulator
MDATLSVLAARGFGDLTIDAIAAEAGITRPVVYDLFGDLTELLTAVVRDAAAGADVAIDAALPHGAPDADPGAMLERALSTRLEAVLADPLRWRLVLMPAAGAPAAIREEVARRRAAVLERVTPLVELGIETLGLAGVDEKVVARVLIATAEDMARLTLEHPRRYSPARVAGSVAGLVGLVSGPGGTR